MNSTIINSTNQRTAPTPCSDDMLTQDETSRFRGQTIYQKKLNLAQRKQFYLRLALFLAAINMLIIFNSFGQLVTINNLAVNNAAQITIKGDLLNSAGTTIANSGLIDLSGNFVNNSGNNLFGTSDGEVVLNGNNQAISGTDVTHFNNLTLEGTGVKTLQQQIQVGGNTAQTDGVLSLGDRPLDLNSQVLTVTNESAAAITRNNGYIVSETDPAAGYGTVNWNVKNSAGTFTFPFGNLATNSYLPVVFDITQPGTGVNGTISIATYPTVTSNTPNNRPLPTGLTSLINNFGVENAENTVDRWWVLDVANYTAQPVSSLTFSYRESEWNSAAGSTNVITESLLQAQSTSGTVWDPVPVGNVNPVANTVNIPVVTSYNKLWTLVGNDNPLPMTLLTFNVELNKDEAVEIDWATATEINNDFFTLEKSKNGVDFVPFEIVEGAGNSNNTLFYSSLDQNPYKDKTYYRLKQTDYDGQYSYSEVKSVQIKKMASGAFQVYPNPATDHFYVKFDEEVSEQTLFVMDMNGKVLREISVSDAEVEGFNLIRIDRLSLNSGMYFITTSEGQMQKLVLQ